MVFGFHGKNAGKPIFKRLAILYGGVPSGTQTFHFSALIPSLSLWLPTHDWRFCRERVVTLKGLSETINCSIMTIVIFLC